MAAAALAAKKGAVGLLKGGLSAISAGVSKAKKGYATKHEGSVLSELKYKGLSPTDYIFEALVKVYYLFMADYKHEVVAAALQAGKRLTDMEKSSVPIEVVVVFGQCVCEECLLYGDFAKGKFQQTMQEVLTKANVAKEQVDRDSLVHDIYYGILFAVETVGIDLPKLEQVFKVATSQVIKNATGGTTASASVSRKKAAKAIYVFTTQIKLSAQETEAKRQKALKDAENLLRKEQERHRPLPRSSYGDM